ncbi:MAG: hypothetical protein GY696_04675 [Gammaproteobacteria bacterium]|nr:hypothetical protein [Gammaproteobacteria bacterium]
MITLEVVQEFLGWCTVINAAMLSLAAIAIFLFRGPIVKIHSKMFDLSEEDLSRAYFQYIAQYKIIFMVFNFVPYVVLIIIS